MQRHTDTVTYRYSDIQIQRQTGTDKDRYKVRQTETDTDRCRQIETETDRYRHRQIQRQTGQIHRKTDTETDRYRDRQIQRQTDTDTCIYRDRQNIYWDTKGEAESRKDTHQDQKEKGERKG